MTPSEAVLALIAASWTEPQIAAAVGTTQPTINRIRNVKSDPAWPLGQKLVDLAQSGELPPVARDEAA